MGHMRVSHIPSQWVRHSNPDSRGKASIRIPHVGNAVERDNIEIGTRVEEHHGMLTLDGVEAVILDGKVFVTIQRTYKDPLSYIIVDYV